MSPMHAAVQALARVVREAHEEAASRMLPLAGPQCPILIVDDYGTWCCQAGEGHSGGCIPPDPILGIT